LFTLSFVEVYQNIRAMHHFFLEDNFDEGKTEMRPLISGPLRKTTKRTRVEFPRQRLKRREQLLGT
jgi:hypothetical protein